jgi:hypothetical protein
MLRSNSSCHHEVQQGLVQHSIHCTVPVQAVYCGAAASDHYHDTTADSRCHDDMGQTLRRLCLQAAIEHTWCPMQLQMHLEDA